MIKKKGYVYYVESTSKKGKFYRVDPKKRTCSCPGFLFHYRKLGNLCKHIHQAIEYCNKNTGKTVFEDSNTNEDFISALKKIPHFGYSVMHSNPYIHMSLLDYKDGSSFEILVHEPNKIVILPQIRASSVSLERVIGHISEKFGEGDSSVSSNCIS